MTPFLKDVTFGNEEPKPQN